MDILHYSLGFPPFRRGGMTQYCLDLMAGQAREGHNVALLWPGRLRDLSKKSKIVKKQKYNIQNDLFCESYELFNPLPIPLMDGIKEPGMYFIIKDKAPYFDFFKNSTFKIFHIHTFMGLPVELIAAAHEAGVKIVFTTHDYFPICPRCNLFHAGKDCLDDQNCADCVTCNQYGLSFRKMKFFQSELYRGIKENTIVKALRAKHNRNMYDATAQMTESEIINEPQREKYQKLRKRNLKLLERMDAVHVNSTNTLHVYRDRGYLGNNAHVISISNGAIANHKKLRKVGSTVRFGYLGPLTTHKGYNLFKDTCDLLWKSGQYKFEAHIFVQIDNHPPYMVCHKPYSYNELSDVMDMFDILVTPSECEETFGFTVLEALSYGIPVIVSNKVGAKDLIIDGKNGFTINGNVQELKSCFKKLIERPFMINEMNLYIVKNFNVKTMQDHVNEMIRLYRNLCDSPII